MATLHELVFRCSLHLGNIISTNICRHQVYTCQKAYYMQNSSEKGIWTCNEHFKQNKIKKNRCPVFSKQELHKNHYYTWCSLFDTFARCIIPVKIWCYQHEFLILHDFHLFTASPVTTQIYLPKTLEIPPRSHGENATKRRRNKGRAKRENSTLHKDNKFKYYQRRGMHSEGNYRSDSTEALHESNISRATDGKSAKVKTRKVRDEVMKCMIY